MPTGRGSPRGEPFFVAAARAIGCMHFCIAALHNSTSRQRLDECYLSTVQIGQGRLGEPKGATGSRYLKRNQVMSIQMNRILDAVASFAIVVLGLSLAGATAVVGA